MKTSAPRRSKVSATSKTKGILIAQLMRDRCSLPNRAIFRHFVILHQSETPVDQCRFIFVLRRDRPEILRDPLFQFRLLLGVVEQLENLHREQPVLWMLSLLGFPNLSQTLVTHLPFANIADLLIETLEFLPRRIRGYLDRPFLRDEGYVQECILVGRAVENRANPLAHCHVEFTPSRI